MSAGGGTSSLVGVHDVSKRYGRVTVLDGVTLSVRTGEIVGLAGANGAGKTTLLRLLVGLVHPARGLVTLGGRPPAAGLAAVGVSYFAGETNVPPTVRVRRWARLLGADGVTDRHRFGGLSRGTRQREALRVALERRGCRLYVLDEPWTGLDPDAAEWLATTLEHRRRDGGGVLVSSHRLSEMSSVCDRFALLDHGRLIHVDETALIDTGLPRPEALGQAYRAFRRRGERGKEEGE